MKKHCVCPIFIFLLWVAACAPAPTETMAPPPTPAAVQVPTLIPTDTPTRSPTATTPAESPCGDGLCDEMEQRNPQLCPQDCPETPQPPETDTPLPVTPPQEERCGDGLCDETEAQNPELCPADCATPAVSISVVEPTATVEAGDTPTPLPTPTAEPTAETWAAVTLPSGEVAHLGDPETISQEGGQVGVTRQANVCFILDASGSMNAELPGSGQSKLAVAKEVLAELIPQIPAEMRGALWAYGHRYPQEPQAESCRDIEQIFALEPVDAGAYILTRMFWSRPVR